MAIESMMNRRSFMELAGGMGMLTMTRPAAAADNQKTKLYLMESYALRNGTQAARLHSYFSKSALPALNKIHSGPKIVLEALVARHMPQVVMILGFESFDQMWSLRQKLHQDEELQKAFDAWQTGPEPPFEHQTNALLEAARYSPDVVPLESAPKSPRIFELRVYHSPTWQQLGALHERFSGSEIKIFQRTGVRPLFYTSTVIGPDMPNLTYLTPFDDLAAREKAWAAFGADPEWVKVRQESIDQHGQIVSTMQISLFRAASYSPVQ